VDVREIISRVEALQHAAEADTRQQEPTDEAPSSAPEQEIRPNTEAVTADQPLIAEAKPAAAKSNGVRIQVAQDPDFDNTPYALTTVGEGHLTDFLEEALDIIEDLNRSLVTISITSKETAVLSVLKSSTP
jgi:two-component system chemotaxis sensor kinase CheA